MRSLYRKLGILLALAAVAGIACAGKPRATKYEMEGPHATTSDGLRRVKRWEFRDAFIKPGVDLSRYDKIVIDPITIAYKKAEHPEHASKDGVERGTYKLSPKTTDQIESSFQKIFTRELDKSKIFAVVEQAAPDAIRVGGHIVELVVYAPPRKKGNDASVSFLANRGEFILVLDLRDSKTGEALIRIGNHSNIAYDGAAAFYPDNPVTTAAAVRQLFKHTAFRLRERLDILHKGLEIPHIPEP